MKITILSIVLFAALPALPTLAQDNNCYKPDIGREEMVKCLEDKHEQSKKEIESLYAELKMIKKQLEEQISKSQNRVISSIGEEISSIKNSVSHKNCQLKIVNPRYHRNDEKTLPHQLTEMYCPNNMYVAGVRIVNNSSPKGLPPIDRIICCKLW
ncbi:MAG: hypothetical protein D3913_04150 [Candidatus Electrothrix sp. LOE1_4_5]|nr:hypothetical protein [Candidatus Electrothrix gigas]